MLPVLGAHVPIQMRTNGRPGTCIRNLLVSGLLSATVLSILLARRLPPRQHDADTGAGVVSRSLCHPNLARLRSHDGSREVLLIGTLPLDLDGGSGELVGNALGALRPDVIMVEGTYLAAVRAMLLSGSWEVHGVPRPPPAGSTNWSDIADSEPVELQYPRPRGLRSLFTPPGVPKGLPSQSLVPSKVFKWARYLSLNVGVDVKVALTTAASTGVPVHFLGETPRDGMQGQFQVSMLAQQAARELLEEEQQQGAEMRSADVDAALRRAEGRVREDASSWLRDARSAFARSLTALKENLPPQKLEQFQEVAENYASSLASRIEGTMESYTRAAVLVPVDQLVWLERKLKEAGYEFVSTCA